MEFVIWDWTSFAVRWLHVVTAIAWIGSSFYFVALDLGLRAVPQAPAGASGEAWQVHGGGFYHIQKYMVAPSNMPERLTWFKWESYGTWLSGFSLLCLVYYAAPDLMLIDRAILDVPAWGAVLIGLCALASGWIVYDLLCRSPIGERTAPLAIGVYALLAFEAWALAHLFSGRGAFVHLGAIIATIMTANVFLVIIPNQKKVVADLIAGRAPAPALGKQAKQRSLHNNYLTLPVIFLMLSGHFPLAFATPWNWVIAALAILGGGAIRHWFNVLHAHGKPPYWTWIVAALCLAASIALSAVPAAIPTGAASARLDARTASLIASPHFPPARDAVLTRCSMCHAKEPVWTGIVAPPKGIALDDDASIATAVEAIYMQAAHTWAMPPNNLTDMTPQERGAIAKWARAAAGSRS